MGRPDDRDLLREALPAYEIGDELGRGAWGIVLAGRHTKLRRDVAVKLLPHHFAVDEKVRARFRTEARLLAALDHPHIVPIYEFVDTPGCCALVMERLTGGTVWSVFNERGLSVTSSCALIASACAGLHYAHGKGVLHRDVKPENMLLSRDGVLKITDFGIAKVIGGAATMATRAGYVLGTPSYLAPEQARSEPLTPATDVYAAGTVLYELLSGELPFPEASNPAVAVYQRAFEDPRPLGSVLPALPSELSAAVDRALAREVEHRYQTAEAFGTAVTEAARRAWGDDWSAETGIVVHGSTRRHAPATVVDEVSPSELSPLTPAATASRGRRTPLLLAAAIGLAMAVAIAALVLRDHGNKPARATLPATLGAAAFNVTPTSGPIGQTVTVASVRPCPPLRPGDIGPIIAYVEIVDPRRVTPSDNGDVYGRQFDTRGDRSWAASVDIPGEATPGDVRFKVACLARDPHYESAGPYYDYDPAVHFTVTPR